MTDAATLSAFAFSFFLIAISPGLCMSLAMALGIRIGVRRTLWMMLGELVGIALVAMAALFGLAALLLSAPQAFAVAKLAAAAFLLWAAVGAWRSPTELADAARARALSRGQLVAQGFFTATSNPKAWIFFAALLPPFVDPARPLWPQAATLLVLMVLIEFSCLLIYAQGGRMLQTALTRKGWGQWLNRISAALMVGIAIWLLVS